MKLKARTLFLLTLALMSLNSAFARLPKVVTTINPIANLAAGVMAGTNNTPIRLLAPNQSPHHYQLRPSDMAAIEQADLFVWIGPDMEVFLNQLVSNMTNIKNILTLEQLKSANLKIEQHSVDAHIWLSIPIARNIVSSISKQLIQLDPSNKKIYKTNAEKINNRLTLLNKKIEKQLQPISNKHYLVMHDGFRYFTDQYQLKPAIPVTKHHGQPISIKQFSELGKIIKEKNIKAIFTEPQSKMPIINALAREYKLKMGELDPLGSNQEPDINAYYQLLQNIADQLLDKLN